jgi:iron complex outermembrane receptor protein
MSPLALLCAAAIAHPALAQERPAHPLDTVRVTSRSDAALATSTRSVEVITREELARRAARSLSDVLAVALGVDAQQRSPAQADLGLRGSTYSQVVILVDGVRVSDLQSGHYALDLAVPVAMIERIEILRGTGSALYGSDAIGGVVNIVTRSDASVTELATRVGSFGGANGRLALGTTSHGTGLRLGADVDRSDGHRDGTDYRTTQVRGTADRLVGTTRIAADVGLGARQFGAADFYSPYPSYETTRSTTADVRVRAPLSSRVALDGVVHTRRHSDVFTLKRDDPAFYQNTHLSWQSGAEAAVRFTPMDRLRVAAGSELLDARLKSARLGDHDERRRAAFVEATVGRPGGAIVDAGFRGDWSSVVGGFASPSVAASVPIGSTLQLRASSGRGFRAPDWTERFYRDPANVGDSALAVERFTAHEVGARLVPVAWASADVALFERHATALIDWARPTDSSTTAPWRTMNFAAAMYRGIEAAVRLADLVGVDWTLRGSGLRFDASTVDGITGKYALRPLTRTLGLSAATRAVGGASLTVDALRTRRSGETDHFALAARVDQRLGAMHASVELLNLTNERYLDVVGKPVAPRSVFVGLEWSGR